MVFVCVMKTKKRMKIYATFLCKNKNDDGFHWSFGVGDNGVIMGLKLCFFGFYIAENFDEFA